MCAQQVRVTDDGEYIIVSEHRKEERRKKAFDTRMLKRRDDLAHLRHRHKLEVKSNKSGYNFTPQISITDLESQGLFKRRDVRHSARAREVRARNQDEMGPRMLSALSKLAKVVQEKESAQYGKWKGASSLPSILSTRPVLVSTDWNKLCEVNKSKQETKETADEDSGHGSDDGQSGEGCRSESPKLSMIPDKPLQFRTTLPPLRVHSIKNETFASLVNAGDLRGLKELLRMRRDEGRLKETDINNALFLAVSRDRPDMADVLLRAGGDPTFGSNPSSIDVELQSTPVILQAVITNRTETVKLLLDFGANPNINIKQTPLHFACRRGNLDIVKLLVRAKADIHARSMDKMTPLMVASSYGEYKCVRYLLIHSKEDINWGDQDGTTALHYAAKIGSVKVIRTLLEHGGDSMAVDDNCRTPFIVAMQARQKPAADLLLPQDIDKVHGAYARTTLFYAVINKHIPSVELLLEKGANVNARDSSDTSPLYHAIDNACAELVKRLAPMTRIKETWDDPCNCLNLYVKNHSQSDFNEEDVEVLKLLLDLGEDINDTTQTHIALLHCACGNYFSKMKTLIDIGAKPDIINHVGISALYLAVKRGNMDMVKCLLDANYDIGVMDTVDLVYDPLNIVMNSKRISMIRLLVSAGCSTHCMQDWPSMEGILPERPASVSEPETSDVIDDTEDVNSDDSSSNHSDNSSSSESQDTSLPGDEWETILKDPSELDELELHLYLMKRVKSILKDKFNKPRPLQEICKLSVKRTLGYKDVEAKIKSLPLPETLQLYLAPGYIDAVFNTKYFNYWLDTYDKE